MNKPLFELGQLLITPGALDAFGQAGEEPITYIARHVTGDWGIACGDDVKANVQALEDGSRIMSVYLLTDRTRIWIITEAVCDEGRRSTCVLLPSEY